MCTVSYIPSKNGVILTSNRDEHVSRRAKLSFEERKINGHKVIFPQDSAAGGSWFAMNERGGINILLNGAFTNHQRILPYARSRGLILLEITAQQDVMAHLRKLSFHRIEPFTLVVYTTPDLWEFRWDGQQKYFTRKDSAQPHIWSSATLYDEQAVADRETLFANFIRETEAVSPFKTLGFHQENHGDFENGFVIDRDNGLKTLSITQAVVNKQNITMNHRDLSSGKIAEFSLNTIHSLASLP